ncbi:NAD-dependent epimerase/dehydratase family protein [Flaviaesturariibacter flavus]|uniref:NAD-dependent epimerase/dehydratase family protein n=1 Tax=Flaviaesturariibacter flavus TaxID=2502780 RepID=A0A4R1BJC3_9BACT|nr:NAD-dependent epimerase/dehydratase family protein [Flaviaesturariibacter flavus]TCJ17406.1 NAD-dependent epimerase/dehydratase family protein [Flaviaesturariibacter flavus]
MENTILVLGGDGYYGWPVSLKLAVDHPDTKIIIADNGWRRRAVRATGADSLVPVAQLPQRIAAYQKLYGRKNLEHRCIDVNSDALEELIRAERPHTIFHMAQQCSAPYSMQGPAESIYTIQNNESGNMRLLWAVRRHVPEAHIVKIGSMGEYATGGGIDIAEGYFLPRFNGKEAVAPMPFPRQSDDVYHISKINDSNYLAMACRKWGLRITEIMQSTLFGVYTPEMGDCEELGTRFDYDTIFGTVVNRFLAQALAGHPLTVYGKGNQTTGIMPMKDAVLSLGLIADEKPDRGVHRVINHVTKANCPINELAAQVQELAATLGYEVSISHVFDPRDESGAVRHDIQVMTSHIDQSLHTTPLREVLDETLRIIARHRNRLQPRVFTQRIEAFGGRAATNSEQLLPADGDEGGWGGFRERFFLTERINLNPGTLGTPSAAVREARGKGLQNGALDGYPLGMYEQGRKDLGEIKNLCSELWPAPGYELMVANGTSQTMNLLALSMLRAFGRSGQPPYTVLTSAQEHPGGIGVFEHLPEFEVHYVGEEVLRNPVRLRAEVLRVRPQLAFLSHVYYASGNFAPYECWLSTIRKAAPQCKTILDVSQSIGLYELPFGGPDVVVGSLHKWVFGPHGSGLTWMKPEFLEWINGLFWNGVGLQSGTCRFSLQGGHDFMMYPEILEALNLYRAVGRETVLRRSIMLGGVLRKGLEEVFSRQGIDFEVLNEKSAMPLVSLAFRHFHPFELYSNLNELGVHCKCIIDYKKDGAMCHVLRFGLPYYETQERVRYALALIEDILVRLQKVVAFPVAPGEEASGRVADTTVAA